MSSPMHYEGCRVAFLTRHGKQDLVREPLERALGCVLVHTDAYDTDQLGTFTREVSRPGSQMEAARRKVQIALSLTGARIGMASEGAFGPDPFGALTPWNTEILLWVDHDLGIEVTGIAHGPSMNLQRAVSTLDQLMQFSREAGFPEHQLALRPDQGAPQPILKGLGDHEDLEEAFLSSKAISSNARVFVENDLRAFCNPTRQQIILKATQDLIRKLRSVCPKCAAPGYEVKKKIPGLPCQACFRPTRLAVGEIWHCQACGNEAHRRLEDRRWAEPARCDACNP